MVDEEEEELMTQYSNANDYFYDSTYKPDFNSNKRPKKKSLNKKFASAILIELANCIFYITLHTSPSGVSDF